MHRIRKKYNLGVRLIVTPEEIGELLKMALIHARNQEPIAGGKPLIVVDLAIDDEPEPGEFFAYLSNKVYVLD